MLVNLKSRESGPFHHVRGVSFLPEGLVERGQSKRTMHSHYKDIKTKSACCKKSLTTSTSSQSLFGTLFSYLHTC